MLNAKQLFGRDCESLAAKELINRGYRILSTNYRTRIGEIDIIARDGESLVFIEVKARNSRSFGSARDAVTRKKMKTISMVALCYLKNTGQTGVKARFDVVAVGPGHDGKKDIEIIKNAFEFV